MTKVKIGIPTYRPIVPHLLEGLKTFKNNSRFTFDLKQLPDCADVDSARNYLLKDQKDYDYILMLDHDVVINYDIFLEMFKLDYPVVCGAYPMRQNPNYYNSGVFMDNYIGCFSDQHRFKITRKGVFESDWNGLGCALFQCKTSLNKMEYPYVRRYIINTPEGDKEQTPDDIGFFLHLLQYGIKPLTICGLDIAHENPKEPTMEKENGLNLNKFARDFGKNAVRLQADANALIDIIESLVAENQKLAEKANLKEEDQK